MRLPYTDNPPTGLPEEDQAVVSRVQARRGKMGLIPLDLALLHAPKIADGTVSPAHCPKLQHLTPPFRLEFSPRRRPHEEQSPGRHPRNPHLPRRADQQGLVRMERAFPASAEIRRLHGGDGECGEGATSEE